MSDIVGILLAAGFSRRFGGDKRLQPLADGRPMAVVAASNLLAACGRVIAVVRPEDQGLAGMLDELGCTVVAAEDAALGMAHSLAAGVAASANARGWLIALADMPRIEAASYRAVLAALQGGAAMARPEYGGRPGHPVGFAAMWRADLLGLQGDAGARAIVQAAPELLKRCPVDDPGVLLDIDLPTDLA
ncbi:MAG: nucleotidyltransferase family protein [Rhodocyclales bacterium GT-UBC]|nr:MAG: nucleotidyltransferase family protein [Rhodocyclales bacterium GT-UBC]